MNLRLPTRQEVLRTVDLRLCDPWKTKGGHIYCDTHPPTRMVEGEDMCPDAYHMAEGILNLFRSRNGIPLPTVKPLDPVELSRMIQANLPTHNLLDDRCNRPGVMDDIARDIIAVHDKHEYPTEYEYIHPVVSVLVGRDARTLDATKIREELEAAHILASQLHLYMRGLRK